LLDHLDRLKAMQWLQQKVVTPFKISCSLLSNDAIAAAATAGVVGGIVRAPLALHCCNL
jgi:NifU-like protein involved in Fe-S cluster formation